MKESAAAVGGIMRRENFAAARVAASGRLPPVRPLARHRMSGAMPAWPQANRVPVRPKPVSTSSAMKACRVISQMRPSCGARMSGAIDQHAARAQQQRLDDQGGGVGRQLSPSAARCRRASGFGERQPRHLEQQWS